MVFSFGEYFDAAGCGGEKSDGNDYVIRTTCGFR